METDRAIAALSRLVAELGSRRDIDLVQADLGPPAPRSAVDGLPEELRALYSCVDGAANLLEGAARGFAEWWPFCFRGADPNCYLANELCIERIRQPSTDRL